MRGHRRNLIWCDGCEQECAFVPNARWRLMIIRHVEADRLLFVSPPLSDPDAIKGAKRVCGDEGVLKLTSRFLSTGSLEIPRNAAADPPRMAKEAAACQS